MKLQEYLQDVDKLDNGFQKASHHVHFEMLDFTVYVIQCETNDPNMLSYILLGWDTNWTTPWNVLGLQVGNEEGEKNDLQWSNSGWYLFLMLY